MLSKIKTEGTNSITQDPVGLTVEKGVKQYLAFRGTKLKPRHKKTTERILGEFEAAFRQAIWSDLYRDDHEAKRLARRLIEKSKQADVLLLDDLGKGTITERDEEELNDLLETRTSMHRQTIWTSNHDGDQLARLFSDDRRGAIMRRLIEFSVIL